MQGRPYNRREERAMVRQTRLREQGYDTYNAYLNSAAWRDVRRRYRESDLPQVCMCGSELVQLHHTTYERVGRELLEDLVPLCQECHTQAHILEAEGVIDLDLQGFYFDAERAKAGKLYLTQLAAACPDGAILRRRKLDALNEWHAQKKADRGRARRSPKKTPVPPHVQRMKQGATRDDLAERSFAPAPNGEYRYEAGAHRDVVLPEPEPKHTKHAARVDANRPWPRAA